MSLDVKDGEDRTSTCRTNRHGYVKESSTTGSRSHASPQVSLCPRNVTRTCEYRQQVPPH